MSRERVYELLAAAPVPKNYKWDLVHRDNLLYLTVHRRVPLELKLFGRIWWSRENGWEAVREIQAPNYASLYAQLEHWPEFLEFKHESVYRSDAIMRTEIEMATTRIMQKETAPGGLLHP